MPAFLRVWAALPPLLCLLAGSIPAHAQPGNTQPVNTQPGNTQPTQWSLERFDARLTYYNQRGRGGQSQANVNTHNPNQVPRGKEDTWIVQPILSARVRQNRNVTHDIMVPVDIVTAASPDALDAVSSASRTNEAVTFQMQSNIDLDEDETLVVRYGIHVEEPLRSAFAGLGFTQELAQDNAAITASAQVIGDSFDDLEIDGSNVGTAGRVTLGANLAFSQMLSYTTLAAIEYGATLQSGRLEQTWNSVPTSTNGAPADRIAEQFPSQRLRHALGTRVVQHLPTLNAFLNGSYRFYTDTFGIHAHTLQARWTQILGGAQGNPRWSLRGSYRIHRQTGADFFSPVVQTSNIPNTRTADSDLATFTAHETGLRIRHRFTRRATTTHRSTHPFGATPAIRHRPVPTKTGYIDLGLSQYWRTNNLNVTTLTTGYGHSF